MAYLEVNELTKTWGEITLFKKTSFVINKGEKVALIAKNGAGKSTLFNILKGTDVFDAGTIRFEKDVVCAFLDQEPEFNPNQTVWEACYHSSNPIISLIREYDKAIKKQDLNKIEELSLKMDQYQAWDMEASVKQILSIFRIDEFDKRISTLSGGQKKRLALANTLINKPDFLILDEPTNHLDVEMIEWLEGYLDRTSITLLMVTHDRYFLDNVCDKIIELDMDGLYVYQGNYSYFVEKRAERIENKNMEIDKANNLLRKEQEWMRRMPKARSTKAKYRVDAFDELKQKASKQKEQKQLKITAESARLGKKIIEIKEISKTYDKILFRNFSYLFKRGEKIGIIGPNGCGKTTFLEIITGSIPSESGYVKHGETLRVAYYKQEGIQFDQKKKVIDIIKDIAEVVTLSDGKSISASEYLRQWLFPDALHHVYFESLSGGEKRRIFLMSLLMKNPNFLILDEPTNDLDLMTLQILEDYLASFTGCVIIVSHDRFFMDRIIGQLFVFDESPDIKIFPGNYTQYRNSLQATRKKTKQETKEKVSSDRGKKNTSSKLTYKERLELDRIEDDISSMEQQKKKIEVQLEDTGKTAVEISELSGQYAELTKLLDEAENRWMELSEKDV